MGPRGGLVMVRVIVRFALIAMFVCGSRGLASAQADEIQVYDGGLAAVGVFNLTVHNNFTPKGVETPAFPGAVVADESWNGVPEWAYGVTRWFEAGLYLPLYSRTRRWAGESMASSCGHCLRSPTATIDDSSTARTWNSASTPSAGIRLDSPPKYGRSSAGTSSLRTSSSIRSWTPRMTVSRTSSSSRQRGWPSPCSRNGRLPSNTMRTLAESAVFCPGASNRIKSSASSTRPPEELDVEFGLGFGLTDASDNVTLKLILSGDFNKGRVSK